VCAGGSEQAWGHGVSQCLRLSRSCLSKSFPPVTCCTCKESTVRVCSCRNVQVKTGCCCYGLITVNTHLRYCLHAHLVVCHQPQLPHVVARVGVQVHV
jgi:hypothetical protein